jgi:hypothetical protein
MRIILFLIFIYVLQPCRSQPILLEAENFDNKGGWFVDPQFYDQMGSFYLLAHGLGIPVKNASTHITVEKSGQFYVYVRTRNWVGDWFENDEYSPGKFQIAINGKILDKTFGEKGKQWSWQPGGTVRLTSGKNKIELIDLTGFDARCDAIVFTEMKNDKVISNIEELKRIRMHKYQSKIHGKEYDLIVIGGGIAGISASISAARRGLKTCLIHNRPVLGGNNSTELKIVASGKIMQPPYSKIGSIVNEIVDVYKQPDRINNLLNNEKNLDLFLNTQAIGVEMNHNTIVSVIAKNIENNQQVIIKGNLFADCTGDGSIGYYAGAEYMMGRETRSVFNETLAPEIEDHLSFGSSLTWNAKKESFKVNFPFLEWAVQFTELSCIKRTASFWNWETGFYKNQIDDAEYIRDYMLRVIYGNWAYLKNSDSTKIQFQNWDFAYVSPILGKRESRRLIGDVIFTQNDIEGNWKKYDDAFIIGTYAIDQHFPEDENSVYFPRNEFISNFKHDHAQIGYDIEFKYPEKKNPPYYIPYRCLYSKNINNLFMAGRNISCSRIAFCSTRVQGTTGMMGEVVGIAAYLCLVNNCLPREIYQKYLDQLKMELNVNVSRVN